MAFADNLATLPSIEGINALIILDQDKEIDRIENKPGKQGSLKLYHALLKEFGSLNSAAAKKGLTLFAEHVEDAKANPGKHPNIDRLFAIIENNEEFSLRIES